VNSELQKKVLIVVTKGNWGGAQRYVYDLACGLQRRGHQVIVAAGAQVGRKSELFELLTEQQIHTVPLQHLERDLSWKGDWQSFRELLRLIRDTRPDILHLNSSKVGFLGTLAGRIRGVPRVIFTAHGWASEEKRPWRERALYRTLHWFTVLLSHTTITVSEHTKKHLSYFPFASRKMSTIHNGITVADTVLPRGEAWELLIKQVPQLAAHYTSYRIATIAELHPNKGLDTALEGLAALQTVPWVWVIMGSGELRGALEKKIRERGLVGRVIMAGRIEHAAEYLPAFDLFLLPSRKEGLPYVLLEAGAAGLPVLSTSVGGIPEIVQSMKNGLLIDPNAPTAITDAVRLLAADPKKSEYFGRRLRESVVQNFSTETMIEGTIRVYEGL